MLECMYLKLLQRLFKIVTFCGFKTFSNFCKTAVNLFFVFTSDFYTKIQILKNHVFEGTCFLKAKTESFLSRNTMIKVGQFLGDCLVGCKVKVIFQAKISYKI